MHNNNEPSPTAPTSLREWGKARSPETFDSKTARREGGTLAKLLAKKESLGDEDLRRVAARILEPGAQWVYLVTAIGSDMSESMRKHLAAALVDPAYPLGWRLRQRFISLCLHLVPAAEAVLFERNARRMHLSLPNFLKKASSLPVTPGLVRAAQEACLAHEPTTAFPYDFPEDWFVFFLLAQDGTERSAHALRKVLRAQIGAARSAMAAGSDSVDEMAPVRAAVRIAATSRNPSFVGIFETFAGTSTS